VSRKLQNVKKRLPQRLSSIDYAVFLVQTGQFIKRYILCGSSESCVTMPAARNGRIERGVMRLSDKEGILKQSIEILARIVGDDSVPRNIRRAADEAKTRLLNREDSDTVRAAYAISILDDISNDPNMPLHTRTLIWNVVSQLEKAMEGQ
jgi:uncharacterized protein (UPF0147 family)